MQTIAQPARFVVGFYQYLRSRRIRHLSGSQSLEPGQFDFCGNNIDEELSRFALAWSQRGGQMSIFHA